MLAQRQIQEGALDAMRPPLAEHGQAALELWNRMGGLHWPALPLLLGLYPVQQPGLVIDLLPLIRDRLKAKP